MQVSSDEFAQEISSGARYASRVCICSGDKILEDTFYGGDYLRLISDGSSVTYDRLADTRTTADLTLQVMTESALDLVDPTLFREAVVYSGVLVGGSYEWIEMGTLGIHTSTISRTAGTFAQCGAADRSARIRDNKWRKPYQVASGTDYYTAMQAIVADRARGFTPAYNVSSGALTTPTVNSGEDADPWQVILDLALAAGAEAYFDRQGAFSCFPVPDPLVVSPSLVIGPESGVQISPVSREISNRDVYNGVICRAEAPWLLFPVSDEIWDTDPLSPSYRYGSFGEKPKVITDAIATTQAQCLAAATAEFKKISGVMERISFSSLKDPRLEVGDIIETIDSSLGITGRYVLDTMSYPLSGGACSGTVRRKR